MTKEKEFFVKELQYTINEKQKLMERVEFLEARRDVLLKIISQIDKLNL
jgi:hypothetical protein